MQIRVLLHGKIFLKEHAPYRAQFGGKPQGAGKRSSFARI